jgi:hypothetical protein
MVINRDELQEEALITLGQESILRYSQRVLGSTQSALPGKSW